MIVYLDTSAAMKLLVQESESTELRDWIAAQEHTQVVSSLLLHTELHCASERHPNAIKLDWVNRLLHSCTLFEPRSADYVVAPTLGGLRSLDALHLAVAIRLGVDALVSYDLELLDAAARLGLRTISPGLPIDAPE